MPISPADLVALVQQFDSEQKRLEQELAMVKEKRNAVELIREHIAKQPSLDLIEQIQPLPVNQQPKASFAESVRQAVNHLKQEKFTVAHVENVLRAQGVALPINHTRTRIAIEVKELVRKGIIRLVTAGSGNTPHQYRVALLPNDVSKTEGANALTSAPAIQH